MNFNARDEAARGYLILGVIFIHAVYDSTYFIQDWRQAPFSFAIIKILAPQIPIFFFLSGMSARNIGKKSFRSMLPQSLMLIFTSWASQGLAIVIRNLLWGGYGYGMQFIKAALTPIIEGTGSCNYITWFFTVLAVARLLAWVFERNKLHFVLCWVVITLLVLAARHWNLPENLFEWENWPVATLFMIAGMRLPRDYKVKRSVGLGALVAGVTLTWFNAPGMWSTRPCLTCHMHFTGQPNVGAFGSLPVYLAAVTMIWIFFLWAAQDPKPAAIGRIGRYFGRASLQFLLLHGWLLMAIEPLVAYKSPRHLNLPEDALFLAALFCFTAAIHAFVFVFTVKFLNGVLARCFEYGRLATDWLYRMIGGQPRETRRFSGG